MTATEGLALAGIVLSAFLGYLSYRTARDGRDDAHKLAIETRAAAADDARRARLFERRKDVYEDMLEYSYRIEDTVARTEPEVSWEGMPGPPEWPAEDEARRQSARIAAWGSTELREKLKAQRKALQEFQGAVFIFRSNRDGGVATMEDMQKMSDTRAAVRALVKDIVELVNEELRS
jgi:hypothetical protein